MSWLVYIFVALYSRHSSNFRSKKYHYNNNTASEYTNGVLPVDKATMDKRAARFSLGSKTNDSFDDSKDSGSTRMSLVWNSTLNVSEDRLPESSTEHIVGTCQDIEKQYLRLTSVRIFVFSRVFLSDEVVLFYVWTGLLTVLNFEK